MDGWKQICTLIEKFRLDDYSMAWSKVFLELKSKEEMDKQIQKLVMNKRFPVIDNQSKFLNEKIKIHFDKIGSKAVNFFPLK